MTRYKMNDKWPKLNAAEAKKSMLDGITPVVTDGYYLYGPVVVKSLDGNSWSMIGVFDTFYSCPKDVIFVEDWDEKMESVVFQKWELMNAYEAKEALSRGATIRDIDGAYVFTRELTDPFGRKEDWVFSFNPAGEDLELLGFLESFTYGEDVYKRQYYVYKEGESE